MEFIGGVLFVIATANDRVALNRSIILDGSIPPTSVDTSNVRCVVFKGAGDAFSVGADATAFTTTEPVEMMDIDETMLAVAEFDRPTIAKIDGHCLGAGLELALACDFRVATEGSSFSAPEIDLGMIPGDGGTQRLVRTVGEPLAKELILRGTHISAADAADCELVHRAVPAEELAETVKEYVADMVQGPPIALKVAKNAIDSGQDVNLESGLKLEKQGFSALLHDDGCVRGYPRSIPRCRRDIRDSYVDTDTSERSANAYRQHVWNVIIQRSTWQVARLLTTTRRKHAEQQEI